MKRVMCVLAAAGWLAGCRGPAKPAAGLRFHVRGQVESVSVAGREIDLKTEEIPGFMAAMTMTYTVTDPAALGEMHPGDTIAATLLADGSAADATNMRLADVVVLTQAQPDYLPKVQYHVPAAGDAVPDFKLLDQSGRTVGLHGYRGKVLVLTFIYTRCPLADFCPRMSRNFAQLDKALAADPKMYAATHLLSISFDPAYDTPAVLKSYGAAYTGRYVQETFAHWEFAAPVAGELPRMEQFFDVGVTPAPDRSLQHSLSTVVVDKSGKVAAFWPNNDWSVAEVLAKVKALAER